MVQNTKRMLIQTISFGVVIVATIGCGQQPQIKVDVTPKFTRAVYPVDAKDAESLSDENYDKIKVGMNQDEVRAVFGTSRPEVSKFAASEEYELAWESPSREIAVRFRGDKSISKSRKDALDADAGKPK